MTSNNAVSPIEHKILVAVASIIFILYFVNLTDKIVDNYNQAIFYEQAQKREAANNDEIPSFGLSCCYSMPVYEIILGLQLFTIPLLLLSLRKLSFARFVFSLLTNSFILSGYLAWLFLSYEARKSNEFFRIEDTTLNTYIFYQSTVSEFVLFIVISALFILQSAFLLRFIIERFQDKLFLK